MNPRKIVNRIGILAITLWQCTPAFGQGDPPTPPPTPTAAPTPTPVTEVQQQPNLFQTLQQQQQIQNTINTQLNNFLQTNPAISPLDQRAGLVDKAIKLNMPFSNMSIKIQVPIIKNSQLLAPSNTQVTNVQTEKPSSTTNTPVQTVQIQNATPTKTVEVKTVQVQNITPIQTVQVTDVKTEIKTTTSTTQVTNVQTEKPNSTNNTQSTTVQVLDPTSYSNTKISITDGPTSNLKLQDVPTNLTKLSGFTKLSDFERTPVEGRYGAVVVDLIDHRMKIEEWRLINVSPELKAEKEKLAKMTDLTFDEREKLKTLAKKGDKAPPGPDGILGKIVGAIEEKVSGDPQAKIDREIAERTRLEEIQNAYAAQSKIVSDLEMAQKLDNETISKLEKEIVALENEAAALQGGETKKGDKPALDPIVQRITGYLKQIDLMAAQLKLLKIIRAGDKSTDTKEAKAEAYCKNQILHAIGYIRIVWGLVEGSSPAAVEQRNYITSRLQASNDYDYFVKVLGTPKTLEEFKKTFF